MSSGLPTDGTPVAGLPLLQAGNPGRIDMTGKRFQERFQAALGDVTKLFDRPRELMADAEFSADQKRELLKQWEYDLRGLQVAADENMTGPGMGLNDELMQEVRACLGKLGDSHAPEHSASHKHGG
jgi:hypothetical protein